MGNTTVSFQEIMKYLEPNPLFWVERAVFWRVQAPKMEDKQVSGIYFVLFNNWAVLSDEQMRKRWQFSLLKDEKRVATRSRVVRTNQMNTVDGSEIRLSS